MADQKLTSLSAFTPAAEDLLYGVDDPGGTPVSGKFTIEALFDVLKAPYLKTNEGLISFTQTLTGSNASVALYLQGDYNTTASTSLVNLAIDDTASAATTTFIICERLDGGTATKWQLNKNGKTQMLDGSEASPILSFILDSDTGIYRPGANSVAITVGGTGSWRFESDGRFAPMADKGGHNIGSTTLRPNNVYAHKFALVDGVPAPTALSGHALIYVDQSDGDLKIRFGDGTTKTIVTDT